MPTKNCLKRIGKGKEGENGQDKAAYLQKIHVAGARKDGKGAAAAERSAL